MSHRINYSSNFPRKRIRRGVSMIVMGCWVYFSGTGIVQRVNLPIENPHQNTVEAPLALLLLQLLASVLGNIVKDDPSTYDTTPDLGEGIHRMFYIYIYNVI